MATEIKMESARPTRYVLVHGFNVRDAGKNTVDQLAPYIIDNGGLVDTDAGDYGYFNLWMIRLFKSRHRRRVLFRLATAFTHADVIITHSNGAYFTTLALDMLHQWMPKKTVIHISPALDCNTEIPEAVQAQLVLYTPYDFWVKLSTYLPFFPWGRMGARGYSGDSEKNRNQPDTRIRSHSAWFHVKHVAGTWLQIEGFIKEQKKV